MRQQTGAAGLLSLAAGGRLRLTDTWPGQIQARARSDAGQSEVRYMSERGQVQVRGMSENDQIYSTGQPLDSVWVAVRELVLVDWTAVGYQAGVD